MATARETGAKGRRADLAALEESAVGHRYYDFSTAARCWAA